MQRRVAGWFYNEKGGAAGFSFFGAGKFRLWVPEVDATGFFFRESTVKLKFVFISFTFAIILFEL